MLRKLLFFILLTFVLGACSQLEPGQATKDDQKPNITLEEIETALQEQGLELKEADLPENNFFMRELKDVLPKGYFLDGTTLSIYIFQSKDDRQEGMEAFEKAVAHSSASIEPYKIFTVHNALMFYVEGNEGINSKLSSALNKLK